MWCEQRSKATENDRFESFGSLAVCGGGWVMKNVSFVVVGRRICVVDSDSLVGIFVLWLLW